MNMGKNLFEDINITIINNGKSDYSFVADENNNNNNNANIADKPGEYKNFTGTIKWKGTNGNVENATFKLNESDSVPIVWQNGTWKDGTWKFGVWKNGYDKNDHIHKESNSPDKW